MTDTQAQEAARLAEWLQAAVQTYPQMSEDEPGGYCTEVDQVMDEAAALLRTQAARIAELERELAYLHTTMFAAAVEIQEHWGAHCDAEGYGPANLMHRLERGIASQYGYDAKTLQRVEAERDALRAEIARMREPLSDDALADKCEAWLQLGGATNVVDAFEAGYRACEAHGITKTGEPHA